ncbi:MAG TPA: hypothetical protein VIP98_15055 [Microlunatus sp.]
MSHQGTTTQRKNSGRRSTAAKIAALAASGGVLAAGLSATTPAQAYPNSELSYRYAYVNTSDCSLVAGNLKVDAKYSNGCLLKDSIDDTFFRKDSGGRALKVTVYRGSSLVSKFEFHPLDEKLWIYDNSNDHDTIYATVAEGYYGYAYGAPAKGKTVVDYNFDENDYKRLTLYDNKDDALGTGSDQLWSHLIKS